jgi:c-di-AMP phosphodiesterase-like protein
MEKIAYIILIIVTIAWIIAWIVGMFENIWLGIIGLVTIIGLGLLFIKALTDRLVSKKDDKYSRDVKK